MNSFFKYTLVAVTSFILGVMATKFLSPDNYQAAVTPRQKELQKIAIEAERRPFFLTSTTNETTAVEAAPVENQPAVIKGIESQADYIQLKEKLSKVSDAILLDLNKKFKRLPLNTKDIREQRNNEHLKGLLESMFQEKELWYKTSFDEEINQSKMHLFFKYYNCQDKSPKGAIKLIDTCYEMQIYNQKNGVWHQSMISSSVVGLLWNNDTPYAHVEVSGMGSFSQETNILYAVFPVPNEQMPMQYLKYEAGKTTWIEGREIKWVLSNEKEIQKFQTSSQRIQSDSSEQ